MLRIPSPRRVAPWLGLALLSLAIVLAGNGRTTVYDRDEARFALAVKEMTASGRLVVPTNWGEPRYHKPILAYWLAMASQSLVGPGEFALRLPSAVAVVFAVLATAAAASGWLGSPAGIRAGLVLATALFVVIEGKVLTADAALLLATTVSFWAWGRLRERPANLLPWQLVFWVGVGVGLLAKVVNVAFLAAAACALACLGGRWTPRQRVTLWSALVLGAVAAATPRAGAIGPAVLGAVGLCLFVRSVRTAEGRAAWERVGWRWGLPLALAMALAWAVPAALESHGAFVAEGLGHHLLARSARPFEGHKGPPGYYLAALLVTLFPWGALLPGVVSGLRGRVRADPTITYLVAWAGGVIVLLELVSSKLPHYLLVACPALAILVAREWTRRIEAPAPVPRAVRLAEGALFVLPGLALAVGAAVIGWQIGAGSVRAELAGTGLAALAYGAVAGVLAARGRYRRLYPFVVVGAAGLYLLLALVTLPALETMRISRPLAEAVARHLRPGERVLLFRFSEASLGYYLAGRPAIAGEPAEVARALAADRPGVLLVVPNGARRPAFDEVRLRRPLAYERVAVVRGIVFPDFRPHEVWLVRGAAETPPRSGSTRSGERPPGP